MKFKMKTIGKKLQASRIATLCLLSLVASTAVNAQVIDFKKVIADSVSVGDQINFGEGGNALVMPKGSWKLLAQSDYEQKYTISTRASKTVSFRNADTKAPLQVVMVATNPSTFWQGGRPLQSSCKPIVGSNVQNYGLSESGWVYACSEFYQQLAFPELLGKLENNLIQDLTSGAALSLVKPLLADRELLKTLGENPIIINVRIVRQSERKTAYTFIAKAPTGNLAANDAEANRKILESWIRDFTKSAINMVMEDKPLPVGDFPTLAPMGEVAPTPVELPPSDMKFGHDVVQRGWESFQKAPAYDRIFLLSKDKRAYQWVAKSWPFTNMLASEVFAPRYFGTALMVNETYIPPVSDTAK